MGVLLLAEKQRQQPQEQQQKFGRGLLAMDARCILWYVPKLAAGDVTLTPDYGELRRTTAYSRRCNGGQRCATVWNGGQRCATVCHTVATVGNGVATVCNGEQRWATVCHTVATVYPHRATAH